MKRTPALLAAMLLMPLASLHAAHVTNLRCEYLADPAILILASAAGS